MVEGDIEAVRVVRFVRRYRLLGDVARDTPFGESREQRSSTLAAPTHRRTHPHSGKPAIVLVSPRVKCIQGVSARLLVVSLSSQLANEFYLTMLTTGENTCGVGGYEGSHTPVRKGAEPLHRSAGAGYKIGSAPVPDGSIDIEPDETNALAARAFTTARRLRWRRAGLSGRVPRGSRSPQGVVPHKNGNARSDGGVRAYRFNFDRMTRVDDSNAWRTGTCGARHADRTSYARPCAGRESENRLPGASE